MSSLSDAVRDVLISEEIEDVLPPTTLTVHLSEGVVLSRPLLGQQQLLKLLGMRRNADGSCEPVGDGAIMQDDGTLVSQPWRPISVSPRNHRGEPVKPLESNRYWYCIKSVRSEPVYAVLYQERESIGDPWKPLCEVFDVARMALVFVNEEDAEERAASFTLGIEQDRKQLCRFRVAPRFLKDEL